jgi:hypothetical protein
MEKIKIDEAVEVLKKSFPGAKVIKERIAPKGYIIQITYNGFEDMAEETRQSLIWSKLAKKFKRPSDGFSELLNQLSFILTWTESEEKQYNAKEA